MARRRWTIAMAGISLAACTLARDPERYSSGTPDGGAGASGAGGAAGSGANAGGGGVEPTGCVSRVSTSGRTTCALRTDGMPFCWGDNFNGQLGDATKTPRGAPVEVKGFVGGVTHISAGSAHTCAVKGDATLWCWGDNEFGQLGIGNTTDQATAIKVPLEGVEQVSAGNGRTCALGLDGTLWCWGSNGNGWLGVPESTCTTTCSNDTPCCRSPIQIPGAGTPVGVHSALGTAAWDANGKVYAWGGLFSPVTPTEVAGITGAVLEAQQPGWFSAARTVSGSVWVWGQMPSGGAWHQEPAELVMEGIPELTDLASSVYHLCVGTVDGVWCWGENCYGQRGDGSPETCDAGYGTWQDIPTRATNLDGEVLEVATGFGHTCAVTAAAELWCWGRNDDGELGGESTPVPLPIDFPCP